MTRQDYIADLRSDYLRRGFAEVSPRDLQIPHDTQVEPDLVLRNGDGEVVILQVKRPGRSVDPHAIARAYDSLNRKVGWTYRFLVVPDAPPRPAAEEAPWRAPEWVRQADEASRAGQDGMAAILVSMALETSLRALVANHQGRLDRETDQGAMEMARHLRGMGQLDDDDLATIYRILEVRDIAIHGYEVINARPSVREAAVLARDMMQAAGIASASSSDGPGS